MLDNNILNDKDYMYLIDKYINNKKVMKLKDIPHHDSNRLNHSLKVSYYSYKICKKLNLNYISAAKAGILHDLFFTRSINYSKAKDKIKLYANMHPEMALENAKKVITSNYYYPLMIN